MKRNTKILIILFFLVLFLVLVSVGTNYVLNKSENYNTSTNKNEITNKKDDDNKKEDSGSETTPSDINDKDIGTFYDIDNDGDGLLKNRAQYISKKLIAPIDPDDNVYNGPENMIKKYIEVQTKGNIPTYLTDFYQYNIDTKTLSELDTINWDNMNIFDDIYQELLTNPFTKELASNVLRFRLDNGGVVLHSQSSADIYSEALEEAKKKLSKEKYGLFLEVIEYLELEKEVEGIEDKKTLEIFVDVLETLQEQGIDLSYLKRSTKDIKELIEVLKGLGYKSNDINKILPNIDSNLNVDRVGTYEVIYFAIDSNGLRGQVIRTVKVQDSINQELIDNPDMASDEEFRSAIDAQITKVMINGIFWPIAP